MFLPRIFRLVRDTRLSVPILSSMRSFHPEFTNPFNKTDEKINKIPLNTQSKYKVFRDEDSQEIFDVEEEKQRYQIEEDLDSKQSQKELGLNLERGINGVYNIEDLVDVLRNENADNIFVCSVPRELKYVDYLVVATGRSFRHMTAIAQFVRRLYKTKRNSDDILPRIEGEKSRDWMALDLGNIALHIFSKNARQQYDLESLWSIGSEFDVEFNKPEDPLVALFERHSMFLGDLKPKETT